MFVLFTTLSVFFFLDYKFLITEEKSCIGKDLNQVLIIMTVLLQINKFKTINLYFIENYSIFKL